MIQRLGELSKEYINKNQDCQFLFDYWHSFISHDTMCNKFWMPIKWLETEFNTGLKDLIDLHKLIEY